jgi:hypothetical protein
MSRCVPLGDTAQPQALPGQWLAVWHASSQGPFPIGNNALQPSLAYALPGSAACDQSFRMILHLPLPHPPPSLLRFRFSNHLGASPLVLTHATVAPHLASAHVDTDSERSLAFAGTDSAHLEAGHEATSDAVALPWLAACGGRVCVTFAVHGRCDSITWHAKAMTTSYLSAPCSGPPPPAASDEFFQHACTSWFFLCGVEALGGAGDKVAAVLGDSIVDGTNSTINGCDRWPDIFGRIVNRRLPQPHDYLARPPFTYVINCGIGGNSICHPLPHDVAPHRGGAAAAARLLQEVLLLPGLTCCIWSQGINDFSSNTGASAATVISRLTAALSEARSAAPHVKFVACTVPSALGSSCGGHGNEIQDRERRAFNAWVLSSCAPFDRVVDFDVVRQLSPSFVLPYKTFR